MIVQKTLQSCIACPFLFKILPFAVKGGKQLLTLMLRFNKYKNARRPKEAHIAQNLKGIKILDRAGEDLKEFAQH